jgi:hypothetical protein
VSDAIRQTRVIQRPACHQQHRQGRAPVDSSPYRPAGRQVKIVPRSAGKSGIAQEFRIEFVGQPLDEKNFEAALDDHLSEGIEPWPGRSADASTPLSRRTYALREDVLAFRRDKRRIPVLSKKNRLWTT